MISLPSHQSNQQQSAPRAAAYLTVRAGTQAELRRVDSHFIAYLDPVKSEAAAWQRLAEIAAEHRAATHHCYAYRLSAAQGRLIERAADAGEPLHSAGRPILRVLQGRKLQDILLTVVRYFGGTKLGIGGLIRAYSDAAKAAVELAQPVSCLPRIELELCYPYELSGTIHRVLGRYQARIVSIDYGERPRLQAQVELSRAEALERELLNATSGKVRVERR